MKTRTSFYYRNWRPKRMNERWNKKKNNAGGGFFMKSVIAKIYDTN